MSQFRHQRWPTPVSHFRVHQSLANPDEPIPSSALANPGEPFPSSALANPGEPIPSSALANPGQAIPSSALANPDEPIPSSALVNPGEPTRFRQALANPMSQLGSVRRWPTLHEPGSVISAGQPR